MLDKGPERERYQGSADGPWECHTSPNLRYISAGISTQLARQVLWTTSDSDRLHPRFRKTPQEHAKCTLHPTVGWKMALGEGV